MNTATGYPVFQTTRSQREHKMEPVTYSKPQTILTSTGRYLTERTYSCYENTRNLLNL